MAKPHEQLVKSKNSKASESKKTTQQQRNYRSPYTNKRKAEQVAKSQKFQNKNKLKEQKAAEEMADRERARVEKEERIKNYKKKRLEKTKAISKKTRRGQPLMKDRMQLLLKQIEDMKRH